MTNGRNKGHGFERKIMSELKELGYDCLTSRNESKRLDDAGVDLVDSTPFYFQLKKTERLPNLDNIIKAMPKEKVRTILHAKNNQDALITMRWEDFKTLLL